MEENQKTMQDYIREAAPLIKENTRHSKALTAPLVEAWLAHPYKTIWIVACGSSANAAYCARPLMRQLLGVEIKIVTPFTFTYYEHDYTADDFVFAISQSGRSTNILAALDVIRKQGHTAIGLTGNPQATICHHADLVVDYHVGIELIGFVTKGMTALVAFLMLFAIEAAQKQKRITATQAKTEKQNLIAAATAHVAVQKQTEAFIKKHYLEFSAMSRIMVCGAGAGYGTACEGALKICETVGIPSFPYETEEFAHGPQLQLNPDYVLFFIDDNPVASTRTRQLYSSMKLICPRCFIITHQTMDDDHAFTVPYSANPLMSPLAYLPFFELIAYHMAEDLHRWVKHPLMTKVQKAAGTKTKIAK